jgi:D-lyxose ketol-isomerase
MKRSEINAVIREATVAFARHGWALPPRPRWDVTDLGLGDFSKHGLTLVNLAEQPEYCEKIMYARRNQVTPEHFHKKKKEDIICRWGQLAIQLHGDTSSVDVQVNAEQRAVATSEPLILNAGERVRLPPPLRHSFWPVSEYAILGEVSTANDDVNDNYFADPAIRRFSIVEEDEAAVVNLVSD